MSRGSFFLKRIVITPSFIEGGSVPYFKQSLNSSVRIGVNRASLHLYSSACRPSGPGALPQDVDLMARLTSFVVISPSMLAAILREMGLSVKVFSSWLLACGSDRLTSMRHS